MTLPAEESDPIGLVVAGRYELVRALGQGAFGRTFEARDQTTGRSVALKVLDPQASPDWKARELFEREAAVLRSLRHPGIPEVHDLFTDTWQDTPAQFLIMEYVEGTSLRGIIDERQPLDATQVADLFIELLGILDYLHTRLPPVLHRDIKPANIIVRPGGLPSLVDFGSVRRVFHAPDEGGSTVAGTWGYMPYEQYMGQASPSSDLYSLGATFLHLLTGRPPRDFMSEEGRIAVPDGLPGDARLAGIIARLLRPSPAERYASARDVRHALLGSTALVVAATPAPLPARRRRAEVIELGPVPRAIKGGVAEAFKRSTPGAMVLMDGTVKPGDTGFMDYVSLVFFSVMTAGILPMIYINLASARRRRMRRFFKGGLPASAEITGMQLEKLPFESQITRVNYRFEVDGYVHQDSDQVVPSIAGRWAVGDSVQILYLPEPSLDSVIISTM